MNTIFYHPAKLRALSFLGLLLLALAILGGMIWRNLHHFETVVSYVNYSHRIQNVSANLQQSLMDYVTETVPQSQPTDLAKALVEMKMLMADSRYLSPPENLAEIEKVGLLLTDIDRLDRAERNAHLKQALDVMSKMRYEEGLRRDTLLEDLNLDTQTELYIASITFTLILLGALLFLYRRILYPLNDLRQLLERLTDENYTPITTHHLDTLLVPVFNSYNEMVIHLAELEEAKRLYAQSLQREVRLATQALLDQQNSLARAERLAAIGEVAAELAHEIRNPLAGIQMAFNNLRREINDVSQCERMDLISDELKRLARLLNDMLNQSKHTPEIATHFDMVNLIDDLLTLTRYQLVETITLTCLTPERLMVHLPQSGVRQALLNLILNAADALDNGLGAICIKLSSSTQGLRIEVYDNGHGFSQDMLSYGIRPFRTSRARGTGLGLAMVQRFVKDCDGSIKLSNQEPHGACVMVFLPKECLVKE